MLTRLGYAKNNEGKRRVVYQRKQSRCGLLPAPPQGDQNTINYLVVEDAGTELLAFELLVGELLVKEVPLALELVAVELALLASALLADEALLGSTAAPGPRGRCCSTRYQRTRVYVSGSDSPTRKSVKMASASWGATDAENVPPAETTYDGPLQRVGSAVVSWITSQ